MNEKQIMGDMTTGKCMGAKSRVRTFDDGGSKTEWTIGVQVERPNGYDEPDLVTTDFRLSKAQVDAGIFNEYAKLKGQFVSVPFWINEYENNGKRGSIRMLHGHGRPLAIGKSIS
ncbi:MAG: DNA-binding protein [Marinobacter sp.]|uniref:DNA-binding protein n=1 Tax=Marinobacter sp. TaxID=50741 RepID=UPI0034A07D19